jgi:quaternary ammonium compound-resistance protein SugE
MSIDWQDTGGLLALGLLVIALALTLAGIESIAGYEVLAAGQSAFGFLAAGNFSLGILSAGIFSVGVFSVGVFSVGIFSIGIFAIGPFAFGMYAVGFYVTQQSGSASRIESSVD